MRATFAVAASLLMLIVTDGANAQAVEDELRYLLETHPQLEATRKQQDVSKERVTEARSNFLPQVDFIGDIGREDIDKPDASSTDLTRRSARLRLKQSVFSGFRNPGNLSIAKIGQLIADQELNSTTQSLLFSGYEIYLTVLATRELGRLAQDNVSSIQTQLTKEEKRASGGASTELEVLFTESRLRVAQENQVFFRGRFDDALVRFQRIIGRPPGLSAMVLPALPDPFIPDTLDEALETARDNNPTLQTADALINRAAEEETVAAADHFPQLDIVAETNYEKDFDGTEGSRTDYFVGLRVRWKLFSGFGTRAAVAAAKQNTFSLRDEALDAKRGVEEDVGRSWENMETANERVVLLEKAVDIAGQVFDLRQQRREQGTESEINVLDAQQEFFRAQIQLVEAQFVARVARYKLLQSMGVLTPEKMGL